MQLPYAAQNTPSLLCLLQETALFLWKDWPKDMELSGIDNNGFVLHGECPHCRVQAAFPTISGHAYEDRSAIPIRMISAARCIACNGYILAIVKSVLHGNSYVWLYDTHYPLGKPNDAVAEEIPPTIKPDFQEALRCRWVEAYNATVEMCRRALEASCIEQGAPTKLVLNDMIDWVHAQGKITTPLKEMAHKIKLGGNRGAHPSDRTLTADDADAVIKFTRNYFENVYVMPASMAKFNFDKPKKQP